MIIEISGKRSLTLRHIPGPQGVRGRNSDNTRIQEILGWEPTTALKDGMVPTYTWIDKEVKAH